MVTWRDQGWRWRSGSTADTVLHFVLLGSTLINVLGVSLGLGFFGTGLTTSIPVLFAARATIGFFAGVGSTARAYVADL